MRGGLACETDWVCLHGAVLTVLASQHRVRFAAQPQQLAFVFSTVFTCLTGASQGGLRVWCE